jgi:hypothetical protein
MFSDLQLREAFHFCFLQRLLVATDPRLYVLKGGVNLRFFFQSPRYSEDMDLDVLAGSVGTLKKNGYRILEDAAFQRRLRIFGIDRLEINDPVKAKHTETTQRFRCTLVRDSGLRLATKVEFSRRTGDSGGDAALEPIDPEVARPYRQLPYRCRHYSGSTALVQKIEALAGRAVTQARDVFDLGLLIESGFLTDAADSGALDDTPIPAAIERLSALSWDDYRGQVVEFLGAESRDQYGTPEAWDALQASVFESLQTHA